MINFSETSRPLFTGSTSIISSRQNLNFPGALGKVFFNESGNIAYVPGGLSFIEYTGASWTTGQFNTDLNQYLKSRLNI